MVTSNDSRMRLFQVLDKAVVAKYAGHENTSYVSLVGRDSGIEANIRSVHCLIRRSQIRANFSDDGRFIISGSEDRHVYSE